MIRKMHLHHLAATLAAIVLLAACTTPLTPAASQPPAPAVEATAAVEEAPVADTPVAAEDAAPVAITCSGQPTPAQTEGPYYTANPPQKSTLIEEGMGGERVLLTGYVLDTNCQPIPNAVVDFWQADAEGNYDNTGYRLRGYTLTDAEGRYAMETIIPGEYPGRPPHIHVKIQPPGGATLTSQLYFPDRTSNQQDNIFNPALIVEMQEDDQGAVALFNFVVAN
jgi:protocatechuate 3,4-dioxygenase beta subunit